MNVAQDIAKVTEPDTPQNTNAGYRYMNRVSPISPCPRKSSTVIKQDDQGPDYKQQCRGFIPTPNSPPTDAHTEDQVTTVRCSHSSSLSSSSINHSYIPFVCGVPLHEDENAIYALDPQIIHNATTASTNMNADDRDTEVQTSPEQAPVPQIISVKREIVETQQPSTLSNAEKRYWIKVVVIAIIINTLIVLGGVMGGVCGISGCDFSTNEETKLGNNMYGANLTDFPTPAPSRRLVTSEPPVVGSVDAPTPQYNVSDESFSLPSVSPVFTFQPSTTTAADGGAAGMSTASSSSIKWIVIVPIAIIVDAMLIVGYLCYHYSRWTRRRK